jgi:hypothetical protein
MPREKEEQFKYTMQDLATIAGASPDTLRKTFPDDFADKSDQWLERFKANYVKATKRGMSSGATPEDVSMAFDVPKPRGADVKKDPLGYLQAESQYQAIADMPRRVKAGALEAVPGAISGAAISGKPGALLGGMAGFAGGYAFPPESKGEQVASMAAGLIPGALSKPIKAAQAIKGPVRSALAKGTLGVGGATGTMNVYRAGQGQPLGLTPGNIPEAIMQAGGIAPAAVESLVRRPIQTSPSFASRGLARKTAPGLQLEDLQQGKPRPEIRTPGISPQAQQAIDVKGARTRWAQIQQEKIKTDIKEANLKLTEAKSDAAAEYETYAGMFSKRQAQTKRGVALAKEQRELSKKTTVKTQARLKEIEAEKKGIRDDMLFTTNEATIKNEEQIKKMNDTLQWYGELRQAKKAYAPGTLLVDPRGQNVNSDITDDAIAVVRQNLIEQRDRLSAQRSQNVVFKLIATHEKFLDWQDPKLIESSQAEIRKLLQREAGTKGRLTQSQMTEMKALESYLKAKGESGKTLHDIAMEKLDLGSKNLFVSTETSNAVQRLGAAKHNEIVLERKFQEFAETVLDVPPNMRALIMAQGAEEKLDVFLSDRGASAVSEFMDFAGNNGELKKAFRESMLDNMFSKRAWDRKSKSFGGLRHLLTPKQGQQPALTAEKLAALYEGNVGAAQEVMEIMEDIAKHSQSFFERSSVMQRGVQHFIHYTPYALVFHAQGLANPALWAGIGAGAVGIAWPKVIDSMMENKQFRRGIAEALVGATDKVLHITQPLLAGTILELGDSYNVTDPPERTISTAPYTPTGGEQVF